MTAFRERGIIVYEDEVLKMIKDADGLNSHPTGQVTFEVFNRISIAGSRLDSFKLWGVILNEKKVEFLTGMRRIEGLSTSKRRKKTSSSNHSGSEDLNYASRDIYIRPILTSDRANEKAPARIPQLYKNINYKIMSPPKYQPDFRVLNSFSLTQGNTDLANINKQLQEERNVAYKSALMGSLALAFCATYRKIVYKI